MRRALPVLALALVAPLLTSCGLLGGGSDLDDALDLVPQDALQWTFRDRQEIADRLDVGDVEQGADDADVQRYAEALATDATGSDDLLVEFATSMQDLGFSELTVRWSVTAATADGVYTAYQVDDDVDLDDVADRLVDAGWAEDDVAGRRHLVLAGAGSDTDRVYPSDWVEVSVDPDEELLVVGRPDAVFRLVDDQDTSAYDGDRFDDLLDDTDDVQFASVVAPPTCGLTRAADDAAAAASADDSGVAGLGTPVATAYLVSGDDGDVTARLEMGDDAAAEADLEARRTYLADGTLVTMQEPVADTGRFELEREGAVVRVDVDLDDRRRGYDLARRQDAFLACDPGSTPEAPAAPTTAPTTAPSASATGSVVAPSETSTVDLPAEQQ